MSMTACVGLTDTFPRHFRSSLHGNNSKLNKNGRKNFYEDKNYQLMLECLNGGYDVCIETAEYMEDYCELLQKQIAHLTNYDSKWKSKLRKQSSLSSYHTTKRAQIQTVSASSKEVEALEQRVDAIQEVIREFRREIARIYPKERFGTSHKHYRTNSLKKQFKAAHSLLSRLSNELHELREQEKTAQSSLREAEISSENLSLDLVASKKKATNISNILKKKTDELKNIQRDIKQRTAELEDEKERYRRKALEIYEEGREFERERLDVIGKALIKFIEAAHPAEHVTTTQEIYTELLSDLNDKRDTSADLDFWANAYDVYSSKKSQSPEVSSSENDDDESSSETASQNIELSQRTTTD